MENHGEKGGQTLKENIRKNKNPALCSSVYQSLECISLLCKPEPLQFCFSKVKAETQLIEIPFNELSGKAKKTLRLNFFAVVFWKKNNAF